jgi:hypothetical protein
MMAKQKQAPQNPLVAAIEMTPLTGWPPDCRVEAPEGEDLS